MFRQHCEVTDLDLDGLKSLWTEAFGSVPPQSVKRELLVRLLAYEVQERANGSLPRSLKKHLSRLFGAVEGDLPLDSSGQPTSALRLGARLVRSWNGVTHEVTVLGRGFAYRGKQYRSLSEIAEVITGAHWSGPRFFGLKKLRSKQAEKVPA